MSEFPEWWTDTVTIYNRYEDPQTNIVKWFKHTVTDCFWNDVGQHILIGETKILTDDIICRIPKNEQFLPKYLWLKLPNDKMSEYFTLSSEDILIRGEVDEEIDEYRAGHRLTDILSKYKDLQGCCKIKKVSDNTGDNRGLPHYHIRGI